MAFSKHNAVAIVCISNSLGGLELTAIQLAREFNLRGADCMLVVPSDAPLARVSAQSGLRTEFLNPRLRYADLLASIRLAKILTAHSIEIVVVMQSRDVGVVAGAQLLYRAAKVVFYQQMQSKVNKRDAVHSWLYSRLSLWISLTERMKQEVLEYTRVPESIIRVVPLGRDAHLFDPKLFNQHEARQRYGLPLQSRIVGVLGRLDRQKGQEEFLRSMPLVLKHCADVFYVIGGEETRGENGFRKHLVDVCNELGIESRVRFLPYIDNVPEFMAALDVFVMPSYSETFGLVLIEAMCMEKPIIATRSGGVPEIIDDGFDGLLVPPRDERALAKAIVRILKDAFLRDLLSKRAREEALKRFDTRHCVDQLVLSLDSL
jgi:D-inositol-3-phosphate glycosyltransferase